MKRAGNSPAEQRWRHWVISLRSAHPARYPVFVSRKPMRDEWGSCRLGTRKGKPAFFITIDSALPLGVSWAFLLHEWAHALTWFVDDGIDHSDAWGIAYAALWRDSLPDQDHEHEVETALAKLLAGKPRR